MLGTIFYPTTNPITDSAPIQDDLGDRHGALLRGGAVGGDDPSAGRCLCDGGGQLCGASGDAHSACHVTEHVLLEAGSAPRVSKV